MLEFKTEKVSNRITRIFAFATEIMYLVEGDEKAALLDTGSGFGSLRACVEKLTNKPVITLMTHGHLDHAMGAFEFDENYLNHDDDYIYLLHSEEKFRKEGLVLSPMRDQISEDDYIPSLPVEKFKDLKEGDRFDLGGISVEIYACPGHTKGSVVMLIPEERTLLLGDGCNDFAFMFDTYSTTITEYEEALKTLQSKVDGKFDTVLLSHGNGEGHKALIEEVIQVCDDIKAGNTDDVPYNFLGIDALIAKRKSEQDIITGYKRGNIVYNKSKI